MARHQLGILSPIQQLENLQQKVTTVDEYTPPPINGNDAADLLGAIPALLGVVPSEAFIAMLLADDGTLVMSLQVGLGQPTTTADPVAALANGVATSLVLVVVNPRPTRDRHRLVESFREQVKIELKAVYWLPSMWEGAVYTEEISGDTGTMPDYRLSRHTLAVTLSGRVVFENERDLERLYEPAATHPPGDDTEWFSPDDYVDAFEVAIRKDRPMDADTLGALLTLEPYRDEVLEAIEINPASAHDVLAAASRHLVGPERVEVLTAASYAALRAGEGLLASAALQAAFATARLTYPAYEPRLAQRLSRAYHSGVHPSQIRAVIEGDEAA